MATTACGATIDRVIGLVYRILDVLLDSALEAVESAAIVNANTTTFVILRLPLLCVRLEGVATDSDFVGVVIGEIRGVTKLIVGIENIVLRFLWSYIAELVLLGGENSSLIFGSDFVVATRNLLGSREACGDLAVYGLDFL